MLERVHRDAAPADHQLGVPGLDLEHRLVDIALDVDIGGDRHALEHSEQNSLAFERIAQPARLADVHGGEIGARDRRLVVAMSSQDQ